MSNMQRFYTLEDGYAYKLLPKRLSTSRWRCTNGGQLGVLAANGCCWSLNVLQLMFCHQLRKCITGSPTGLSRTGVRRSIAKNETLIPRQSSQLYIDWLPIWRRERLRSGDYQPCQMWFGSDERQRLQVRLYVTPGVAIWCGYMWLQVRL